MKLFNILVLATSIFATNAIADNNRRLKPLQAHTISMPNHTAVIYYTVLKNGDIEVVSTLTANAPNIGVTSQQRANFRRDNNSLSTSILAQTVNLRESSRSQRTIKVYNWRKNKSDLLLNADLKTATKNALSIRANQIL